MLPYIKPDFRDVVRARAGDSSRLETGDIYLDRNERAEPFPTPFREELAKRLASVPINQYPEIGPLYERCAAWLGVDEDQLFFTEGVSGAVKAVIETLARPGGSIVFPDPGFALYPVYAQMYGQDSRRLDYGDDYRVGLDRYLSAIDGNTSAVFVPNPNVPLGGYFNTADLERLADHCAEQKTTLVIDEVYYPFGGKGALNLVVEHDHVLVARSFSKAFGAAGLRFGYLVGSRAYISEISKSRSGYEMNSLTIETALHFLDNEQVVLDHIETVREGISRAVSRFRERGLKVVSEGSGNFFYVDLGDADLSRKICDSLKKRGIHLRGGWPAPWDRGLQISGAGAEIMDTVVDAFLEELSSAKP